MTKREVDLSEAWVKKILIFAKARSTRDYLLFRLYATKGFRRGEIVGSEARHWDKETRKWSPVEATLPGLRIEDLRDDGIFVQGKGWKKEKNPNPPEFVRLSKEFVQELRKFIGSRKTGRIFEMHWTRPNQLCHQYAKWAGHPDWMLVHPHRFRHFGATTTFIIEGKDLRAANSFLRHKSMASTFTYISKQTPEERAKTSDKMETLISV